jgi:hypothetical protein
LTSLCPHFSTHSGIFEAIENSFLLGQVTCYMMASQTHNFKSLAP